MTLNDQKSNFNSKLIPDIVSDLNAGLNTSLICIHNNGTDIYPIMMEDGNESSATGNLLLLYDRTVYSNIFSFI
jgi:hypothetical protein